jgi:predicted ATPase/DNA-binding winged helix-turn-helix (wHTH) protein
VIDQRNRDEITFGQFRLSLAERLLERSGSRIQLTARALDVLLVLIERAGEVVSKKELMAQVWSDVTVDEGSLRFHILALRKALGEGQAGARYITTVSGKGYCFVSPVSRSSSTRMLPPPNQSVERPYRLPARLQRMVGRDDAIQRISTQLAADRLFSIVGPGGIGKTTVAVSVGRLLVPEFDGAVCFFDLGPLSDHRLVPSAVASGFGLQVQTNDPISVVVNFLRDKRMLLIFDNCEHVIQTAAVLAERIFEEAPGVHILVTSRESLRVEGEHVFHLPPLESPPSDSRLSAAEVLVFPAARLFVERIVASGRPYQLSDADAPIVGEICRRLDGVALAIELAASQVHALGVQQTAALLDNRLSLVWEGRRTAVDRQQTLGATLDWSHNLLSESERLVLRRVSVFVGEFTLEAACAVASSNSLSAEEVIISVASLVAKSLLSAITNCTGMRYRMLETTRAYALAKLAESDGKSETSWRHANFYLSFLQRSKDNPSTVPDFEGLTTYAVHLDNIRAALAWCLSESGDSKLGVGLSAASASLFLRMSLLSECRHWAGQAIDALDDATRGTALEVELQAALGLSLMFTESNSERAHNAFKRGLELAEGLGDLPNQFRLIGGIHHFNYVTGNFRFAMDMAQRGEIVAEAIGDPVGTAAAHSLLGISHYLLQDIVAARSHLANALAELPVSGRFSPLYLGLDYRNRAGIFLARTLWLLGYPDQAKLVARRTVEEAATFDHPLNLCISLLWAVCVHLWSGEWAGAQEGMDKLIACARERSILPYDAAGTGLKGYLLIKRGEAEAGVRLLRTSLEALQSHRYEMLTTIFSAALAEGLLKLGNTSQALKKIDGALAFAERNEDLSHVPELHRIRGEILASGPGADHKAAEVSFARSLAISRDSSALSWELRAAISLAAHWTKHGSVEQARALLAPVAARFSEGFETADFIAAGRLLVELD